MPDYVNTFITVHFLKQFVELGGDIRILPLRAPPGARVKFSLVCTYKDGTVRILNDRLGEVKGVGLDSVIALLRRETGMPEVVVGTEFGDDFIVPTADLEWKSA